MENTYSKYAPNVFLAKCSERHEKNEVIQVTTQHGKENDCIIYNLIFEKDGFYFYSIVRADGFNAQEHARNKIEKLHGYAENAEKKSDEYYNASNKDREFLSLGEPIKIGHHSEGRHRRIIEQAHNNMSKCVEYSKKAEDYQSRVSYWENRTEIVNLSMPESIEYYEFQLEKARLKHEGLKNGSIPKDHSFSLTYAKKELNDIESKLKTAHKLWGNIQIKKELIPKTKTIKQYTEEKTTALFDKTGAFFAFSTAQFDEAKKEGVKYVSMGAGLICPKENAETLIKEFNEINKAAIEQDKTDNGAETIIKRELYNYECFYVCDIRDAVKALKKYGYSEAEIKAVYDAEKENAFNTCG